MLSLFDSFASFDIAPDCFSISHSIDACQAQSTTWLRNELLRKQEETSKNDSYKGKLYANTRFDCLDLLRRQRVDSS